MPVEPTGEIGVFSGVCGCEDAVLARLRLGIGELGGWGVVGHGGVITLSSANGEFPSGSNMTALATVLDEKERTKDEEELAKDEEYA